MMMMTTTMTMTMSDDDDNDDDDDDDDDEDAGDNNGRYDSIGDRKRISYHRLLLEATTLMN